MAENPALIRSTGSPSNRPPIISRAVAKPSISCAPDVGKSYARQGSAANMITSRIMRDGYAGGFNFWSREHYDNATLLTKLALVAGPPE
jgi:hypothetical protein